VNKEPLMFNVTNTDHELFFLVSCHEHSDSESTEKAIRQMVTSIDQLSFEKNEPVTSRAAVCEIEPQDFPDVEKVYEHNGYTPTENTKILIKCYIKHVDESTQQEQVTPFHGRISFQDGKYFLSLLTEEEIKNSTTNLEHTQEESIVQE
jgi:hypothetical protein